MFDLEVWQILLSISLVTERLVEFFGKRFFVKYEWDTFWLLPITWVLGGLLTAATMLNLFEGVFVWSWVGILLTAVVVGAGSNFMHEILSILNATKGLLRSRDG